MRNVVSRGSGRRIAILMTNSQLMNLLGAQSRLCYWIGENLRGVTSSQLWHHLARYRVGVDRAANESQTHILIVEAHDDQTD